MNSRLVKKIRNTLERGMLLFSFLTLVDPSRGKLWGLWSINIFKTLEEKKKSLETIIPSRKMYLICTVN